MSCSTSLYNNFIQDWIDTKFKSWFVDNVLIKEAIDAVESELEEESLASTIATNEEEFIFQKPKRDHYKPPGRSDIDWSNTSWGLLINNIRVKDPESKEGKVFRRRFRIPFSLFEYLLELSEQYNLFGYRLKKRTSIPDKYKL